MAARFFERTVAGAARTAPDDDSCDLPGCQNGTEGQRLIVFMIEVAAFRIYYDDYPPAGELDLITCGNDLDSEGPRCLSSRKKQRSQQTTTTCRLRWLVLFVS